MRLTKQTNYAVRILLYCGANQPNLSRVPEIAEAYKLSVPFLFKILKPLLEAGYLESVRGRNGGIKLAKPANQITLYDVVMTMEDNFQMADCFGEETNCPLVDSCDFNAALSRALGAFFDVLKEYTIEDLYAKRPNLQALLGLDETTLTIGRA